MTRDPFLRLALITACSVYFLGVGLVARWLGPVSAILVVVGGVVAATGLTLEAKLTETPAVRSDRPSARRGVPLPRSER